MRVSRAAATLGGLCFVACAATSPVIPGADPAVGPIGATEAKQMKMQLDVTGEGEPLVIVGGGLTGSSSFVSHADKLAPRRRVARANPLGVQLGAQPEPLPRGYSIALESRALAAALDDLGWSGPIDVVGWSMGGTIALAFALDYPERIRSLVLVEPDTPWTLTATERADPEVVQAERAAARWVNGVTEDALESFMAEMLGPGSSPREHPRWPVWNAQRGALRALIAIYQHDDDLARLSRFSKPILLVEGEGTARYNRLMIESLARAIPAARVQHLPGGHLAPLVAMDQFLDAIEAFQRSIL